MNDSRQAIARSAARRLETISGDAVVRPSALIGFDGFIDSILHMVDKRTDMSAGGYTRIETIGAFAARCGAAAGRSTNIEQVLVEDRFGGNGPLMAGALASLGTPTVYIGAVGDGSGNGVHPVFQEFACRCDRVIPTGPPSTTLCLEFDDGKLMFNNTANVQAVTWARIVEAVGLDALVALVESAELLGVVNWSLLGGVPGIWEGLARDVWPRLSDKPRRLSIDLSDPAKRSDADVADAMRRLGELESLPGLSVTLGLNLAESDRIVSVLGGQRSELRPMATLGDAVVHRAREIQRLTGLDCVAVHPREGAAAASAGGEAAWIDGPFVAQPRLSTGAGDHFNAGFAFGQMHAMPIAESLACGVGVSGAYVRDAASPSAPRLREILMDLPLPQRM